mgnify:CR=1 FL=1
MTISFGIMMVSMACEEEVSQDCLGDQAKPVEQLFEGGFDAAGCRIQNIEFSSGENNFVIKNQSDYEKYVTCNNDLPNIDFDKYFILAGVYSHHQCAIFDNQSVELCDNRLKYKVKLKEQICFKPTDVKYFTVIERKYQNLPVVFDVNFSN